MIGYYEFIKSINLNSDYSIFYLKLLYFAAFAVFITFLLFFLLTSENANAVEPKSIYFGEEINISDNNGTSELPQVTAEGNNVYVVWQDNSSGNYDVYFAHSPDNGKNFESIKNLSKNNGTSELPQVTAEGNNVYVVWQDNSSGNYDVYFAHSPDNGKNFESIKNLSKNNGTSELPQVTAEGNNVYVVWQDNSSGNYDVYFAHSPDNGKNFESIKNLSKNNGTSELPQVTAEGNNVYVVWQDNSSGNYDVYFAHSPDNGKNFESIKNLSKNNGTSELPQVTAEGNNVYVVWQDNSSGNYDVYFKPSSSDGTKFKSTRNLSKNNGTSQYPKIASHNDVFYVVWKDDSNGNQDIFSKDGRIENLSTQHRIWFIKEDSRYWLMRRSQKYLQERILSLLFGLLVQKSIVPSISTLSVSLTILRTQFNYLSQDQMATYSMSRFSGTIQLLIACGKIRTF